MTKLAMLIVTAMFPFARSPLLRLLARCLDLMCEKTATPTYRPIQIEAVWRDA